MKEKEGKEDMAVHELAKKYTLNEEEANIIISTPPKKIKQTKVPSDIFMSKNQRISQAANILKSKKWKKK